MKTDKHLGFDEIDHAAECGFHYAGIACGLLQFGDIRLFLLDRLNELVYVV